MTAPTRHDVAARSEDGVAIDTFDATRLYGDVGVRDLTLQVPEGSIFGFIGPSGSGKTTTIRLLTGLEAPDRGSVRVLGQNPVAFDRDTRARIGYLPQESVLYPELTIYENLDFAASIYGLRRRKRRLERLLEFVELDAARDRQLSRASGGMARRLGLAAAFVHSPELLFLDEPTASIDPVLRQKFWDRFRQLRDEGRTLFVTTQYVGEAAFCDQVGVLSEGELLTVSTPEDLRRTAYGGELIDVTFDQMPPSPIIDDLGRVLESPSNRVLGYRTIRFVVPDAGTAIPKLSARAGEHDLVVTESERVVPEFDEIFVEIVSAHRRRDSGSG